MVLCLCLLFLVLSIYFNSLSRSLYLFLQLDGEYFIEINEIVTKRRLFTKVINSLVISSSLFLHKTRRL